MKKTLIGFVLIMLAAACSHLNKIKYDTIQNGDEKILKGVINRSIIESDTSFKWFKENMKWGQADAAAIEAFKKNKDKFTMIVFGGTWCHDTQNLLPVFYRLVDKSGYPDKNITLIGVDRKKQTLYNLQTKYNIKNVPTFIVMHDGKEVGRVVEYGKEGAIDKELGQMVASIH